ncbi:hypothetical protein PG984_015158 [Apiospora sp. TS-2023a]
MAFDEGMRGRARASSVGLYGSPGQVRAAPGPCGWYALHTGRPPLDTGRFRNSPATLYPTLNHTIRPTQVAPPTPQQALPQYRQQPPKVHDCYRE